jgi:hypothetical protein
MNEYAFPPDKAEEIVQHFAHRMERKMFLIYCAYHNSTKAKQLAIESTQQFIDMKVFEKEKADDGLI